MNIVSQMVEELIIEYSDDEREKAFAQVSAKAWTIKQSGPHSARCNLLIAQRRIGKPQRVKRRKKVVSA